MPNNKKDAFKLPGQITLTAEEVEKSQKVEVINVNSDDLIYPNEILCFNALGLIGKGREKEKKDGIVYYCNKSANNKDKVDCYLNTEYQFDSSEKFYIFATYYIKDKNGYNINIAHNVISSKSEKPFDFYMKYSLFIKLEYSMQIKIYSKEIIKFGNIILEFAPITGGLLSISNVNDPNSKQIFHPEEKHITIGSSKSCTLSFPEEKISKFQASIDYISSHAFWNLKEEDAENEILLYGINEYPLSDGMTVYVDNKKIKFKRGDILCLK